MVEDTLLTHNSHQPGGAQQIATEGLRFETPAIEMLDLCKTFGKTRAVDHLTLSVQQGEIFGLLGPNGSGKTTTINMLSGLSAPTSGLARVLGYDVQHQALQVKRLLGCIAQETALFEELSAEHNLRFHAALYHVPRRERRERIAAMLHLVHLYEKRGDLVKTFSGGMKRRLALARALLHQPRILYLDEPSLGVDVQNRYALYGFIRRLPEQGVTVLLTTNDMHEAEQLCTRIAIIDHGRLQVVDTPLNLVRQAHGAETRIELVLETPEGNEDLALALGQLPGIRGIAHEQNRFTITTDGGQSCLGAILREVVQQERTVLDIRVGEAELEAVFLRVTGQLLRD